MQIEEIDLYHVAEKARWYECLLSQDDPNNLQDWQNAPKWIHDMWIAFTKSVILALEQNDYEIIAKKEKHKKES